MREMPGHQSVMLLLGTLALRAGLVLGINQLIPYAAP